MYSQRVNQALPCGLIVARFVQMSRVGSRSLKSYLALFYEETLWLSLPDRINRTFILYDVSLFSFYFLFFTLYVRRSVPAFMTPLLSQQVSGHQHITCKHESGKRNL